MTARPPESGRITHIPDLEPYLEQVLTDELETAAAAAAVKPTELNSSVVSEQLSDPVTVKIKNSNEPDKSDKGGTTVKHPDKHYEKVAKLYLKHGSVAKVQNHFPNYSESTVRRWVAECRKRGLVPPR